MDNKPVTSLIVERGKADMTVSDSGSVSGGPDFVKMYRLLTIQSGLKLEMKGMRLTAKAPSCFSIIKKEFGVKGRRDKMAMYLEFCQMHGLNP